MHNYVLTGGTTAFSIVDGNIGNAGTVIAAIPNQRYTGLEIKPAPTVTAGATPLTPGTDYTVSYANNIYAGRATVTVTGAGNYTGSKSATFIIVAPPAITVDGNTATVSGNTGDGTKNPR
jgi:hypothetical protein